MTCTLHHFPADDAIFARLTERQRLANIAAERAEAVEDARAVLRSPERHSEQVLRDACAVSQAWGDGTDWLQADAMIHVLNRREWQARNCPRRETPMDVARRFAHRWPEIVSWGAFVALLLLWATGWLA